VQTFLPYPDFSLSAQALDSRRLGSQRNEAYVVLAANLCGPRQYKKFNSDEPWSWEEPGVFCDVRTTPWYNHPVTIMWRGSEYHLAKYALAVCEEWRRRGFADSMQDRTLQLITDVCARHGADRLRRALPAWLGDSEFHRSHQSNLLRKDCEHYSKFMWNVPADLPYVYPKGAVE